MEQTPSRKMGERASAGIIKSEDADEHREAVRPWDLRIGQMSPGKYRAITDYLGLNRVLGYRERCDRRSSIIGGTPSGYVLIGSPAPAASRIDWCGGEIHVGRLAFGTSSTEVDILLPEGSHHVALLVREDLVLEQLGEGLGSRVLASGHHHLTCHPSVGASFVRTVDHLVDRALEHPELLVDPGACKAMESQLVEVFFQTVGRTVPGEEPVTARGRRLALQRAVAYAEDLRRPLSVAEFAAATGVGRRTLELAFKESLQVSPLKYLRWSRMNAAHRDLIAATPDSARVKDIATQWGFSEPGRFAVEYRRFFGEPPSETLRRRVRPLPMRLEDALRA
jgi:AraC-like DNA-binding protein